MSIEDYIIADEARFINLPAVTEIAASVVENTRVLFSVPKYDTTQHSLEVTWLAQEKFRAWASVRIGVPAVDRIAISYGAAREIYRDAFVLPLFCERHFNRPHYEAVYNHIAYGAGTKRVLPAGLSTEDAKTRIMNSALAWLYLHEQSHLFQNHGRIGQELGASWASEDQRIEEMRDLDGLIPTGKSAALSHVLELAADYEAMNNVVGLILKANQNILPAHSLWTLVVGLTCMFQRFYGLGNRTYGEEVSGTHPDPSFRMRVLLRNMVLLVMHPEVRKYADWISKPEDLDAVTNHAVITATMYCQIRYRGDAGVSAFLPGVQGYTEVPVAYQQALFDVWSDARPRIIRDYRGWGEECVLDIPNTAYLS
jgi:hypothetical protein